MAFNQALVTSALTQYTDQLSSSLVREIVLEARTNKFITVQSGVKYQDALNVITSLPVITAASCDATPASGTGSVTLIQNTIQVCPLMMKEVICQNGANTLEQYWTGMKMKSGSYYDDLEPTEFAKQYMADKVDKMQDLIELIEWQGNSTGVGTYSTNPNATQCNGFLYMIDYTYPTQIVTVGATTSTHPISNGYTFSGAWTVGGPNDAIAIVDAMATVLPQNLWDQPDLILFCSYANFRTYVRALRNSQAIAYNFPAIESDGSNGYSIMDPGTNIRLLAVSGLVGSNRAVLTPAHNLVFGTDLEKDYETFRIWKSEDFNAIMFRALWKQGVSTYYPTYIVATNG